MVSAIYMTLGFMVVGAVIAVETVDLLSSIISVGAVGSGLIIFFLMMEAPDLAIVQVVVEILTLIILIAAFRRMTTRDTTPTLWGLIGGIGFVSLLVLMAVCWQEIAALPPFGEPLLSVSKKYLEEGLQRTGAVNLVTAILLDFRAYDTLGEATVLFTAAVGVLAVLRRRGKKT